MAIDLASLLSGNNLDTLYRNDDPYYQAARGIAGIQTTAPRSNTEAFLLPFLQNTLAGGLAGYGKENARQTQYQDISSMLGSMGYQPSSAKDPYAMAAEAGSIANLLGSDDISSSMYGQAVAPEGFSGKIGMADLLLATSQKQAEQEAAAKYQELQDKLNIESSQPYLEMIRKQEEAKASGKSTGEGGVGKLPEGLKTSIAKQNAIVNQATKLGSELIDGGDSWIGMQGAKRFSGLDQDGVAAKISDLVDRVIRIRTGATAPPEEVDRLTRSIVGDGTASPAHMGKLLLQFANSEKENAQGQLDFFDKGLTQTDAPQYVVKTLPNGQKVKVILGK